MTGFHLSLELKVLHPSMFDPPEVAFTGEHIDCQRNIDVLPVHALYAKAIPLYSNLVHRLPEQLLRHRRIMRRFRLDGVCTKLCVFRTFEIVWIYYKCKVFYKDFNKKLLKTCSQ